MCCTRRLSSTLSEQCCQNFKTPKHGKFAFLPMASNIKVAQFLFQVIIHQFPKFGCLLEEYHKILCYQCEIIRTNYYLCRVLCADFSDDILGLSIPDSSTGFWLVEPGNTPRSPTGFLLVEPGNTPRSSTDFWLVEPGNTPCSPTGFLLVEPGNTPRSPTGFWLVEPGNTPRSPTDLEPGGMTPSPTGLWLVESSDTPSTLTGFWLFGSNSGLLHSSSSVSIIKTALQFIRTSSSSITVPSLSKTICFGSLSRSSFTLPVCYKLKKRKTVASYKKPQCGLHFRRVS